MYHIDPGFGVNQGYKFWQCVQPNLYNHPQDVLDQGIANIILSSIIYACFLTSVGDQKPKSGVVATIQKKKWQPGLFFFQIATTTNVFVNWLVTE